jgi:uncharacterized membrane protein YphA (DoxX/SURF4 family)
MAVETRGTVHMRGEKGPGVVVTVHADGTVLRLESGPESIGEWDVESIGIQSLNDGFAIRAEGEEFVLKTDDDVGIAEEIGIAAASPRLARKVAAAHPPEDRSTEPETKPERPGSGIAAIVFALGGVLVLSGGFFLRESPTMGAAQRTAAEGLEASGRFWFAFVVGGLLMVVVSVTIAIGFRWSRVAAVLTLIGLIVLFALAAQDASSDADFLFAYGFIAAGIVVGVAVLFSGSVADLD